jgi:hypothetical protein
VSPVHLGAFEFGNLGADVVAALDQQIVVRDFLLRPLPGVGADGRKILYASLDHGQLGVQPKELRGPIHYCSPTLKRPTVGWAFETPRHDTTRRTPVYSGGGMNTICELAEKIHELLERAG